jgi:hypothetical protein
VIENRPARVHWAVAFAALVGGLAGSFVARSMDRLGISTERSFPLLAGEAAIYVASLLGALLGATVGALTAFGIGRSKNPAMAAVAGSVAGILMGVVVGYFSEYLAQTWVNAFSGNPLEGALAGGLIAGGFAGAVAAAMYRLSRKPPGLAGREEAFVAAYGSVLVLFAGMGGASMGATLAQSVLPCPDGYFTNPDFLPGCASGILEGSLLLGIWGGAIAGAVGAPAASLVLAYRGGAGSSLESPT